MNRVVIFLMLSVYAFATYAQDYDEEVLPSDRNHWTVTVAYDESIPGDWKLAGGSFKMFKPGGGVSLGVDYMLFFNNKLFFEPGVRFFIDNYRYDNITIGAGTPEEPSITCDPPVMKTGMRLPLTLGYKFDVFKRGSLFLATGLEPIIGFTARTSLDEHLKDIFTENMYKTLMSRYDMACDIRAAIIIDHFRVDLTGALGLFDVIKTDAKMHEYRISIGLGYVF